MARKRMFDKDIINQDSFFDLPMDAKALYFLLGMEADDEGFVSPKKVLRLYGGTEDSLKVLALKKYIIPFKSGVIVITDWKRNNYIQKDRLKETIYQEEKAQLEYDKNTQKYICLSNVKQPLNSCSTNVNIDKIRLDKNRIDKIKYNVEDIITYFNKKCNTHYKTKTKNTYSLIKARLEDGYTIEDFKNVIDKKYNEWYGTQMEKYLRPSTLFRATNFESYVNQNIIKEETQLEKLQREIKEAEMEESEND